MTTKQRIGKSLRTIAHSSSCPYLNRGEGCGYHEESIDQAVTLSLRLGSRSPTLGSRDRVPLFEISDPLRAEHSARGLVEQCRSRGTIGTKDIALLHSRLTE